MGHGMKLLKCLLSTIAIVLLLSQLCTAQQYRFEVPKVLFEVQIEKDSTVELYYEIVFKNAAGAHPIDFVDIGLPKTDLRATVLETGCNGEPAISRAPSEYVHPGIAVGLRNPIPPEETGTFYFRIKQVYVNGYVRYSNIRQVVLENSAKTKFSIYPNPSKGIVGIKFDNKTKGIFKVLVYTTLGQMAVTRDVVVDFGSPYMELAKLEPGVYWVRLTDKKSLETSVTQLLIK